MHDGIQHSALVEGARRACPVSEDRWEPDTHRVTAGSFEESHCDAVVGDTADPEESGHTDIDRECGGGEFGEDDEVDTWELEQGDTADEDFW